MSGAWLGVPEPGRPADDGVLHVDCDRCAVRGPACAECVVSVLLGLPDDAPAPGAARAGVDVAGDRVARVDLNAGEQSALAALAGSGLVPPLRLVTAVAAPADPVGPVGDGWDEVWDGWGGWDDGENA